MAKCVDSVHAHMAMSIFEKLGAPKDMSTLLRTFYDTHKKWIECEGYIANDPIRPTMNVLQGCPVSMLLMAAPIAIWTEYVQTPEFDVSVAIYVNDRALWAEGDKATDELANAVHRAKEKDDRNATCQVASLCY